MRGARGEDETSVEGAAADEATLSVQLPGDRRAYSAEVELPSAEGWLLKMADPPPALGLVRLHILAPGMAEPLSGQAKVLRVVSRQLADSRGLAPGIRVQLVRPSPQLESFMFALAHAGRRRSESAVSGPPESPRSRASAVRPTPEALPGDPRRGTRTRPEAASMAAKLLGELDRLRGQNDAERLGVATGADEVSVRRAFFARARSHDPALYRQYGRHDLVETASRICALLAESEGRLLLAAGEARQQPRKHPSWSDGPPTANGRLHDSGLPHGSGERPAGTVPPSTPPGPAAEGPGRAERRSEPRGASMPRRRSSEPPGSDPPGDGEPTRRQSTTLGYDTDPDGQDEG